MSEQAQNQAEQTAPEEREAHTNPQEQTEETAPPAEEAATAPPSKDEATSPEQEPPKETPEPAEQDDLEARLQTAEDKYLRLFAEYDNFRKRTQREKAELLKSGTERLAQAFLPLFDDLDRALFAGEQTDNLDKLLEGLRLVQKRYRGILEKQGIQVIEPKGEKFDAELHEAVASRPVQEGEEPGTVVEVLAKGYKLDDKVIRHAQVILGE